MKNKNLPRKQKPKKRPSKTKKDNFNPWITKYFDLSGCGVDNKMDRDFEKRFNEIDKNGSKKEETQ